MANLDDSYALWPAGIYQLEQTDPVLGGTPNEATGAGMDNIPHLQLARRTRFLKETLDGAGIGLAAAPLVVLNDAKKSGIYRFVSTDPNTPATGVSGTLLVAAFGPNAVNQTAFESGTRKWTRFWNGVVWSAWLEVWQLTPGTAILEANGRQPLPSGLILQWGSFNTGTIGNVSTGTHSFRAAFPTECLQVILGSSAGEIGGAGSTEGFAVTGFTAANFSWASSWNARNDGYGALRYFALGR